MTGAIFTWGYGGKRPSDLLHLIDVLDITHVVDCRRRPQTRIPGFSGAALRKAIEALPKRDWGFVTYTQQGEILGGYPPGSVMPDPPPPVSEEALRLLRDATVGESHHRLLLVCAEKAPGECHRHITIGLPLARKAKAEPMWWPDDVEIRHVYRDKPTDPTELIEPMELQASIDEGRDYECEVLEDDEQERADREMVTFKPATEDDLVAGAKFMADNNPGIFNDPPAAQIHPHTKTLCTRACTPEHHAGGAPL